MARKFTDLEDNPLFNTLVGRQQIIDGRTKSDGLTKVAKRFAKEELGLTDADFVDYDAEDFQFINRAARMIDNMDIQAKKEGYYDPSVKTDPGRPEEEIIADLEAWEASQVKKETPSYKEGDVVTAERDPSIVPYVKGNN